MIFQTNLLNVRIKGYTIETVFCVYCIVNYDLPLIPGYVNSTLLFHTV